MPLEFRILGPLELWSHDAGQLSLGGPKQRKLLGLLLLNRNEVVSADRLIDEVWRSSRVEAAARSLQVYVSELRKVVGGADVLRGTGGGYSLAVSDDQVDAARFERLLDEGRRALVERAPTRAVERIQQALSLWRGPALADLAYEDFAQGEIARLEELRLLAREARLEAELALGRHADLVGELQRLVAERPLRERVRAQLMLALYRCGRQAEALAVYREGRRTLLDELGLQPGPELRELEAAILRQDPALALEPAELRARRHLPAPATALIGRDRDLAEVGALLRRETPRLLTLTGPGGIGKTRLALQAASNAVDRFADGVFFVDLAPLDQPELVAPTIAHAVGVAEGGGSVLSDALRAHLRNRQLLLLLDNFEHVDEAATVVSEILGQAEGVKALVTSRTPLRLYGEYEYAVSPLPEEAAVELFAVRARAVEHAFALARTRAQVADLCRSLDCLPLAIELAAARSNELSPADMLALLPQTLELARSGPRDVPARQRTLRATIEWSYRLLDPREQTLVGHLSVFAGGCSAGEAQAVCGAQPAELAALVDKSLLRETRLPDGAARYGMLATVREYATERLDASGEAELVRRRHAEHFLDLAEETSRRLGADADVSRLERLDLEHDNLRAAFAWLAAMGDPALVLRLAIALKQFWWTRGHLSEGRRAFEESVARASGAPAQLRADALSGLGVMSYRQGAFAAAMAAWEESLELYRALGDATGVARSVGELGSVAVATGDYERAAGLYEESAALFRAAGDSKRLAVVIVNLGAIANMQGDYQRGRPLLEEALGIHRQVGAMDDVALALQNLGRVALAEGRHSEAEKLLQESLEIARDLRYTEIIAFGLEGFAHLATARGANEHAARLVGRADALFEELGAVHQEDDRVMYERTVQMLTTRLGIGEFERARAEGRALELEQAIEDALRVRASTESRAPRRRLP